MPQIETSPTDKPVKPVPASHPSESTLGFLYCVGSSIGYTLTNIFLRAVTEVDPIWVASVKALPTLLIVIPWFWWERRSRGTLLPGPGMLLALASISLLANFGGNVLFQWSLGVLGVAMSVSLTLGAMIFSGAAMGWLVLREQISWRMGAASLVLLLGIGVLSLGANAASDSVAAVGSTLTFLGVLATCFAGFAYSAMGVVMRYGLRRDIRPVATLAVISVVGWVTLTSAALWRIGWDGVAATSPSQWVWMFLAGILNALAFVSLTKALQHTTVLMVNGVNASQAALCGLAGVLIFNEALTAPLALGVSLTVLGLIVMKR